jgi:hypothetical protein
MNSPFTTCRFGLCVIAILTAAASAHAQQIATSFDQLSALVKPGDTITVTDAAGVETRGKILALSPSTLEVRAGDGTRTFLESGVRTIAQRRHASLGRGAKWGFVAGAGLGTIDAIAILNEEGPYAECRGEAACALATIGVYGGFGAVAGVAMSALIRGSHIVYAHRSRSPTQFTVAPLLGAGRKGVLASLTF